MKGDGEARLKRVGRGGRSRIMATGKKKRQVGEGED